MACNGKMIVICTVGLIMVLIPVSLYLVADVAHLFWSSRGQLIKESICSASVMRRYNKRAQGWMDYGIEEFKGASFTAESNGEKLTLTLKEYELLKLLMHNAGIVLTREKIMERVWDTEFEGESRTVDMHIKTLRKKLGDSSRHIKTVRNVGYVME